MCENIDRLQEIKIILNKRMKLINISYVGIKSDSKKINIEAILQNLSKEISIPNSEGFLFFDFKNARDSIINSKASDEYKRLEIKRINDFANEFKIFKDTLIQMQNLKNKIDNKFIKGSYKGLKLVYFKDLEKIILLNNEINTYKKKINRDKFGEGMNAFIESFRYKIRGELSRHNIEESSEFTKILERCLKDVKDENKYINNINISCKYVVDISDEILKDVVFINNLDNMSIEDEDKDLIKEYYKLRK